MRCWRWCVEESLIDAISRVLPDVDVYHDFAPEEAEFPLVIVQRVGGAGCLFLDYNDDGYEVRFSVSVWDVDRLGVVEKSRAVERSILDSLEGYALSAADAVVLDDGRRGMVQDFVFVTA